MSVVVRIATIEIPVRDLPRAVLWYRRALGLERTWTDGRSAMLRSAADDTGGFISLLLVETNDARRLAFASTQTGIVHSVVDFYTPDLESLHSHLKAMKAEVEALKPDAASFGFRDPDGNRLGATRDAVPLTPAPAPAAPDDTSPAPA